MTTKIVAKYIDRGFGFPDRAGAGPHGTGPWEVDTRHQLRPACPVPFCVNLPDSMAVLRSIKSGLFGSTSR